MNVNKLFYQTIVLVSKSEAQPPIWIMNQSVVFVWNAFMTWCVTNTTQHNTTFRRGQCLHVFIANNKHLHDHCSRWWKYLLKPNPHTSPRKCCIFVSLFIVAVVVANHIVYARSATLNPIPKSTEPTLSPITGGNTISAMAPVVLPLVKRWIVIQYSLHQNVIQHFLVPMEVMHVNDKITY